MVCLLRVIDRVREVGLLGGTCLQSKYNNNNNNSKINSRAIKGNEFGEFIALALVQFPPALAHELSTNHINSPCLMLRVPLTVPFLVNHQP